MADQVATVNRMKGPRKTPVLGWRRYGLSLLRDPITHLTWMHREFGLISTWEPGRPRHVFVFGPEWNRRVLEPSETFLSDAFREVPIPPDSSMARLRSGLMNRNGPAHRRHRQVMQMAFTNAKLDAYQQVMVASVRHMLDGWAVGETRDIAEEMHRLSVAIGMKTMLGLDDPREIESIRRLMAKLLAEGGSPLTWILPFNIPGMPYARSLRTAATIERFLDRLIRQYEEGRGDADNVLAAMIAARAKDTELMTRDELVGEAFTIFCQETTATALTWTLLLLSQHDDVLAEIYEELDTVLGGAPPARTDLTRLRRVEQALKESMRLLPPSFFGSRYAAAACQLGPYELESGATVFFSQFISHRLPEIYPEPRAYRPRRWEAYSPSPYEYLPFGAGSHACIAAQYAMVEMKTTLAMILQRYRLAMANGVPVDPVVRVALVPRNGLPMTIGRPVLDAPGPVVEGRVHELVDLRRK